jgi:hypothetical protein
MTFSTATVLAIASRRRLPIMKVTSTLDNATFDIRARSEHIASPYSTLSKSPLNLLMHHEANMR